MEHSYEIITMGSATQDVFVKTACELVKVCHHEECEEMLAYPLGSKILIEQLDFQIGGGGTNTAVTFARQGLKTGYVGKLGEDPSGYMVKNFLAKEGIDFLGATGSKTGYSVILDSEDDDRTILTFKGANSELRLKELKELPETGWLYCSSMLGESYETMLALMRRVRERGGMVAFNPSNYQAKLGVGTLQPALDQVDALILNKEEAELLFGHQSTETEELLRALAVAGPRWVVITDGSRGATLFDGERIITKMPHENLTIVETTGAGDAFASGFVAGLARGLDEERALELGLLNAESVIAHYGAKERILRKVESDKRLNL